MNMFEFRPKVLSVEQSFTISQILSSKIGHYNFFTTDVETRNSEVVSLYKENGKRDVSEWSLYQHTQKFVI